jgi:hypothetical protein
VYEGVLNCAFYIVVGFIALSVVGFNVLAFGLAVVSIIITTWFVVGSASRATLQGILLVLVQRPYGKVFGLLPPGPCHLDVLSNITRVNAFSPFLASDIGDRIVISELGNGFSSIDDSFGSIVEDISLFHTTIRSGPTREVATITNSSLARSRIVNLRRSAANARIAIYIKFGLDIPYYMIVLFRKAVENFVRDRPQEFLKIVKFDIARVESELGFIEVSELSIESE